MLAKLKEMIDSNVLALDLEWMYALSWLRVLRKLLT
jgi:hypothetical protein